jgi:hypothetical protein
LANRAPAIEILDRLRGDIDGRPIVDPGLAGGLREWLEDGALDALQRGPRPAAPVFVDRWVPSTTLEHPKETEVTASLARAAMVGALFRQRVTQGRIDDPVEDALSALRVDARNARVEQFLVRLQPADRARLFGDVIDHAEVLIATWPVIPPGWLPRTGERRSVPLSGGQVRLGGIVDLVLGVPARDRASVCLVDVRSGDHRSEHRDHRQYLALLETVCSGAPPFRVATYYTATGEIDVEDVDDGMLANAATAAVDAIGRAAATHSPLETVPAAA